MGKQNHFLGDSETPNTRAPLFIFLKFRETEHRDTQWERGVKVLKKHSQLLSIYDFLPVGEPSSVELSKTAPNGAKATFCGKNRFIDGLRRVQKQFKTCMLGDRVP